MESTNFKQFVFGMGIVGWAIGDENTVVTALGIRKLRELRSNLTSCD